MNSRNQCKFIKANGEQCKALATGEDGLCNVHSGRQDPSQMGQLRHSKAKLPKEVPSDFINLSPEQRTQMAEKVITSGNMNAMVSLLRLWSQAQGSDGRDFPVCKQRKAEAPMVKEKLARLLGGKLDANGEYIPTEEQRRKEEQEKQEIREFERRIAELEQQLAKEVQR